MTSRIRDLVVDAQLDHWARTRSRTTPDPAPLAVHVTAYLAGHGLHVTTIRIAPEQGSTP